MRWYKIRYKTADRIKSVDILARSPEEAKSKFRESNWTSEIVSIR